MRFETEPIAIIGCGKEKLPHAARARDLYTGPVFRSRLAVAEACGARVVYIASARHFLLPDTEVIEPYESDLTTYRKATREAWAREIARQLRLVLHASPGPILALVSGPYAAWTSSFRDVHLVGDGLPVGKLLRALNEAREAA